MESDYYYQPTIEMTTRIIQPNNENSTSNATNENAAYIEETINLPLDLSPKNLDQSVDLEGTKQDEPLPDVTHQENLNEHLPDKTQNELEPENREESETTEMEHSII